MSGRPKYSIITTCKGRLAHLRQTLPAMLGQPQSEVIVVDYDCPDGAAAFVAANHPTARVVKKVDAPRFNASDARNLGVTAAMASTLVFVDADIVLASGFVDFIDRHLAEDAYAKFAEPATPRENSLQGTCVIHRRHFEQVEGYDDALTGYGGEDLELYDRLSLAKLACCTIEADQVERAIEHGQDDRTRFFARQAEAGFLIGKVYRIAKGMMIRLQASFHMERQMRLNLYEEIARLVGNMARMEKKNLRLEIKFPDDATRGLHQRWEFTRSLIVHVNPRQ